MDKFVYSLKTLQHFLTFESENNLWLSNQWLSLDELNSLGYQPALALEHVQYPYISKLNHLRASAVNHYNEWLLDEIGSKLEDPSWGFESESDYWAFKAGMLEGYLQEITSYDVDYEQYRNQSNDY